MYNVTLKEDGRTLVIEGARVSYPHLFVARPGLEGGEPKFSAAFILEEGMDLKPIMQAVINAAEEKWPGKAVAMFKAGMLRNPIRRDQKDGYPENCAFINASSKHKPGVVSGYPGPDGKPAEVTDPAVVYPGAYVNVSVRAYAYDRKGNKGVSFNLNNVQKRLEEADRLDNKVSAQDEFEALAETPGLDALSGGYGAQPPSDNDGSPDDLSKLLGGM